MKKRILCFVLVVLLLAAMTAPALSDKVPLYFAAYNDTVPLALSTSYMPYNQDGTLLVPYSLFHMEDESITPSYNKEGKMLNLFSRRKRLLFDLKNGQVTDEKGNTTSVVCAIKDGVAYVPLHFTVSHFGLAGTMITSESGYYVVRLTNGEQVYDDAQFLRRAQARMDYYIQQFATLRPSTPPEEDPTPAPEPLQPEAYLAVVGMEHAEAALTVLSQNETPAVFFFTSQQMQGDSELVRRVIAAGYKVGLTVPLDSQDVAADLRLANETLDEIAKTKSLLACLPQQQAEGIASYHVISRDKAISASQAAQRDGAALVICGADCERTLAVLNQAGTRYHTIRETSSF